MIVLDASVAVKWYLPEHGTPEALALRQQGEELLAPELIRLEVAAAITRRVRDKERPITPEDALARCDKWFHLLKNAELELITEDRLVQDAIALSVKLKHGLQDCFYLAAARQYDAPLIAADKPLFDRAQPLFPKISMLAGCQKN